MKTRSFWRSLVSYGTAAVLAVQLLGVFAPGLAHAAGPILRITEINWAGSNGHPTDQWVELQNVSGSPIDFSVTPYTLTADEPGGTVTLATLDATAGILPTNNFLVLTREQAGGVNSTLFGANAGALYERQTSLVLPTVATPYHLMQGATEEDAIKDSGVGLPFAGSAGTATQPIASMSRVTPTAAGDQPSSWYTSMTMGTNFALTAPVQYGTPGEANNEVAAPTNLVITPNYGAQVGTNPTVTGSAAAPATQVKVTFTRVSYSPFAYTRSYTGSVDSSGNFSITASGPALEVGRYQVTAAAYDAAGDMSSPVAVAAAPGTSDYDYLITPATSTVPTPTLGTYPTLTNAAQVTIQGTLDTTATTYKAVEVSVNGAYYATLPVSGSTFTAVINLPKDQVDTVNFYAVDSLGQFSLPATATITQDSTAPNPVDATKVTVGANQPGVNDTITGQPGAAEANTTLFAYADAALTKLIVSEPVAADGSFAQFSIGDNQYATVYLVLQDKAGNLSTATAISNPIAFAGDTTGFAPTVTGTTQTQMTVTWPVVPGAVSYLIKYKVAGGTYTTPMALCATSATCTYQTTLIGLTPNTQYVVAMAAVDKYGNISPYIETSATTAAPAPVVVTVSSQAPTNTVPTPQVAPSASSYSYSTGATDYVQNTTATPSPTPTASPSPSPTPEQGEVKSATDNSRNWTPWIILAIIVAIAILATAGYFYWFGGDAGEGAMAAAAADRRTNAAADATKKADKPADKGTAPPKKPNGREKRW